MRPQRQSEALRSCLLCAREVLSYGAEDSLFGSEESSAAMGASRS